GADPEEIDPREVLVLDQPAERQFVLHQPGPRELRVHHLVAFPRDPGRDVEYRAVAEQVMPVSGPDHQASAGDHAAELGIEAVALLARGVQLPSDPGEGSLDAVG